MHIFLTGGTGFVGTNFIKVATSYGHSISALCRPSSSKRIQNHKKNVNWIVKEFHEVDEFDLKGIDVLVHLAAYGVSPQPADLRGCFQFNVLDSLELISKAVDAGIDRIVCAGTYAEYGLEAYKYDLIPPDINLKPIGVYASSKAAFFTSVSALCRDLKFKLSYQRVFSVFGEGQFEENFWPQLRKQALSGSNFKMTFGEQIRDFIHVSAVGEKLLYECEGRELQEGVPIIKNLASGRPISLRCFAEEWWSEWNASGEILFGEVPYRENEVMRYVPMVDVE